MSALRHRCLNLMDWCEVKIARHGTPIELDAVEDRHLPELLTLLQDRETELLMESLPEPAYLKKKS